MDPFHWRAMAHRVVLWHELLLRLLRPSHHPKFPLMFQKQHASFTCQWLAGQLTQLWPSILTILASHFQNFSGGKQPLIPIIMYTPNPKGTCTEVIPEVFIKAVAIPQSIILQLSQYLVHACPISMCFLTQRFSLEQDRRHTHSSLGRKKSKYYYSFKLLLKK